MDTAKLTSLGIALGIVYAAFKFGNAPIKGAAVSIAAIMVAKQIPYVNQYI